jgi:hypothetical protein
MGAYPLARLLDELIAGADPPREIEDFAYTAEKMLRLALTPPRGRA